MATLHRVAMLLVVLATPGYLLPPPAVPQPLPLSSEDYCKAWVIWDEARGEPLRGARAVLDVLHTRMTKRGKTACEVIAQRRQFSGYRHGVVANTTKEALTLYEVVRRMPPVAQDCEYFHATYVKPVWRKKVQKCTQIGNHIFYYS